MSYRHLAAAMALPAALAACTANESGGPALSGGKALYVSAAAPAGGDGSSAAPFNTLAALEAASAPGDTLVILPAPLDTPPLDGGIALQPGQRLIGGGPAVVQPDGANAVTGATNLAALPRIRNTDALRLSGDAVRLAADSEVSNVVITESVRGGIYGLNVPGARVHGNDVSGHNTSCTIGFIVQPLTAPTNFPGVGLRFALPSGWAAIMVDADSGDGAIAIEGNYVHHGDCGNGIDVRMSGSARYVAEVSRNFITELPRGPLYQNEELHLVHSITLQTIGESALDAHSFGNTMTLIGSAGADCEGLFANPAETSRMVWHVDQAHFAHGIGGSSCNGAEFIISNGSAHAEIYVRNSTFEDNPGDMIEHANLGSGATMILEFDNVVVRDTTLAAGNDEGIPDSGIPFNLGECVLVGSSGAANTTIFRMRNSELTGCNNGLAAGSNVVIGNGVGADELLLVEVADSRIHDNAFNNLRVKNLTELNELGIRIEGTDLSTAGDGAVAFLQDATAVTHLANIDLGGGALGSSGQNCIHGSVNVDARAEGYQVIARQNWWGQPAGPAIEDVSAVPPSSIDFVPALTAPPPICR